MKKLAIAALCFIPAAVLGQGNPLDSLLVHSHTQFKPNQAQSCSLLTGNAPIEGNPKTGRIEMYCSERADYDPLAGDNWKAVMDNPNLAYPYTRIAKITLSDDAQRLFHSDHWKVNLFCQTKGDALNCVPDKN